MSIIIKIVGVRRYVQAPSLLSQCESFPSLLGPVFSYPDLAAKQKREKRGEETESENRKSQSQTVPPPRSIRNII